MCHKHYNQNFLHVQFDQWEADKAEGPAQNKCLQPDPRHCGRSPTTLTLDYMPVLELGGALFARKFDATHDGGELGEEHWLKLFDNRSGEWRRGGARSLPRTNPPLGPG